MSIITTKRSRVAALLAVATIASACGGAAPAAPTASDPSPTGSNDDTTATSSEATNVSTGDPASMVMAAGWADHVTITIDGDNWIFESNGLPSHEVLEQYLAANEDGKSIDDSGVLATDTRVTIPLVPTVADAPIATSGGTIGVAISGAVFFNPYEANSVIVANDDNETIDGVPFIDACGGHPVPGGRMYHYHGIPFCITDAIDTEGQHSEVVGYLLDGYAIYGPQDTNGGDPDDLDACLGHTGLVPGPDTPTYHYHVTTQANYVPECLVGEFTSSGPGRR